MFLLRFLVTLACCTVYCAGFYVWTEVSALYFPEQRGLTALVGIVFFATMMHVYVLRAVRRVERQVEEIDDVARAVLMRVETIQHVVIDIQQNPLVEFSTGTRRRDDEPPH